MRHRCTRAVFSVCQLLSKVESFTWCDWHNGEIS